MGKVESPYLPVNESVIGVDIEMSDVAATEGGVLVPLARSTQPNGYRETRVLEVSPGLRTKEGTAIKPGMVVVWRQPAGIEFWGDTCALRRLGIAEIHAVRRED